MPSKITPSEIEQLESLVQQLRDKRAKFIFMGASEYASGKSDLIESALHTIRSLESELALAQAMYRVVLQQRNQAWSELLSGGQSSVLVKVGNLTTTRSGKSVFWELGEEPYLDTALACEEVFVKRSISQEERAASLPSQPPV